MTARPETADATTQGYESQGARIADLLHLQTWLSPAFPTGAFAYSHGLEWAVETHDISDAATLQVWLTDVIAHGTGRTDAIVLRLAHRAASNPARLNEIAALARATAAGRERR